MKYPVSEERCSNCSACSLVSKDILGGPLKEDEMYYQCIAMAEDLCSDKEENE